MAQQTTAPNGQAPALCDESNGTDAYDDARDGVVSNTTGGAGDSPPECYGCDYNNGNRNSADHNLHSLSTSFSEPPPQQTQHLDFTTLPATEPGRYTMSSGLPVIVEPEQQGEDGARLPGGRASISSQEGRPVISGPLDPSDMFHSPTFDGRPFVFGSMLGDGVKLVSKQIETGNAYMNEVRGFLAHWATLERQHATALMEATRAFSERTKKVAPTLSHGLSAAPTSRLEVDPINSSMRAWLEQLASMERDCAQRISIADEVSGSLCPQIQRSLEAKDQLRKQYIECSEIFHSTAGLAVSDLKKTHTIYTTSAAALVKRKIDLSQVDMDSTIKGQTKSSRTRVIVQYCSAKNKYLLTLASASCATNSLVKLEIPWVLDEMESLERSRVMDLKYIMSKLSSLRMQYGTKAIENSNAMMAQLEQVKPSADSLMFALTNKAEPLHSYEVRFESAPHWRDSNELMRAGVASVMLRNFRFKIKERIKFRLRQSEKMQMQLDAVRKIKKMQVAEYDPTGLLHMAPDCIAVASDAIQIHTEMRRYVMVLNALNESIGDSCAGEYHHSFRKSDSRSSKNCAYCEGSLFSLSKKIMRCTACGLGCHVDCELKVIPNCSNVKSGGGGNGHCKNGSINSNDPQHSADGSESMRSFFSFARPDSDIGFNDSESVMSNETSYTSNVNCNSMNVEELANGLNQMNIADSGYLGTNNNTCIEQNAQYQGNERSPHAENGVDGNVNVDSHFSSNTSMAMNSEYGASYAWVEFEYIAKGEGEISVSPYRIVRVPDWSLPGNGWVGIEIGPHGDAASGMVPASYIRDITSVYDPEAPQNLRCVQFDYSTEDIAVSEGQLLIVDGDVDNGWLPIRSVDGTVQGDVPESYVVNVITDTSPAAESE